MADPLPVGRRLVGWFVPFCIGLAYGLALDFVWSGLPTSSPAALDSWVMAVAFSALGLVLLLVVVGGLSKVIRDGLGSRGRGLPGCASVVGLTLLGVVIGFSGWWL